MPKKNIQTIRLSDEDRDLIKRLFRWIKIFPLIYLAMWVIMCIILFLILLKII